MQHEIAPSGCDCLLADGKCLKGNILMQKVYLLVKVADVSICWSGSNVGFVDSKLENDQESQKIHSLLLRERVGQVPNLCYCDCLSWVHPFLSLYFIQAFSTFTNLFTTLHKYKLPNLIYKSLQIAMKFPFLLSFFILLSFIEMREAVSSSSLLNET